MERTKAIDLIQKVLAKANNNPNENEAELAMLKAQELLVKYNLTMSDVEISEYAKDKEVIDMKITDRGKTIWWVKVLSGVISENFRCQAVTTLYAGKSYIRFIGLKEDVEVAQKVFGFAKEILTQLADDYVDTLVKNFNADWFTNRSVKKKSDFTGEKNDYIKGFLRGLDAKYKEQIEKNNWGLILVKDDAVTEYIDNNLKLKASRRPDVAGSRDGSHYDKGYSDGKSFDYKGNLVGAKS